jgi:hypothetical protein
MHHNATRMISFAALAAALAACGSDSSGPAAGFECLGQALPTTAPALVNVTGTVNANVLSPNPVPHAFVYGFRTGDTTHLAGDTTDTPGRYSLSILTGGLPVNGYVAISDSGHHLDTYAYPAVPLAADATENVLMISSAEVTLIGPVLGVTQDPANGLMVIVVENCAGQPISGATVTTTPAGTVRYNGPSGPNEAATSTAADGISYVFNVPAGNVVVHANASGHTLRQHTVNAHANAFTLTAIQP